MNKKSVLDELEQKTKRTEQECIIINSILEDHFIVGHRNKAKIKDDFMDKLNISESEADELYNTCVELIVKGIFK